MLTRRKQQFAGGAFFLALALALWGCVGTINIVACRRKRPSPGSRSSRLSQTVTVGQPAIFSVTVTGTGPFTYQWQKNSANISGATSSTYTTPATVSGDNGAGFRVVVTNSAGSAMSNSATLTVDAAAVGPGITTQPASQTVTAGQTATFTVAVTGTAPFIFQWQKNNANISGATSKATRRRQRFPAITARRSA